ncbi:MAG: threonine--tRNA ligase [Candidatus Binatus sp.]|jgi:threonyl-tRNA synthetase|uniref:threonine--tRNA ligase n=1 Tax=Candidatus Binatus sp. TaxID=2811406 RepID=UPI003C8FFE34
MSSKVTVTVGGESRVVPVGTIVRDVLDEIPSRELVAARVNGKLVDLTHKLEHDASVEPVMADSPAGLETIRHSTAHLMAMAVQSLYPGTQVTIGPVIEDGFFYDFAPAAPFTVEDLPKIEARMRELVKADHKIQRSEVSREDAIRKFSAMGEKYKVEIIQGIPDDHVSIYSQGDWLDLCRGPHVPSTRYLKAFKLTSVAGAYWRGDEHNAMLSRIYGTAFASKEALEEHLKLVELARQRDHRKLGREMGLYIFDPISPGSPFYLPKGVIIFNALVDYMRRLYRRYGYDEVVTPLIFKNELFNTSGHWENFRENMFLSPDPDSATNTIDTGPDGWRHGYGLKPMNCPGHTFVYRAEKRSYRDLPLRIAEFSRLHRAERSGTLHGLMRVRAMSQDDAHIFCREDQIEDEIALNLQMVREVYGALGFERVEFKLATMPEHHLGTAEQWQMSEAKLGNAMKRNEIAYEINPKEGAFYGPKIEIYVSDALKRKWQVATIQLDPNMPERFDLTYTNSAGAEERPVMIHRAILGSLERFIGVLIEHTGGVLPLWLAPEQVRVLSLSEKVEDYAKEVTGLLRREGLRAHSDIRNEKLGFKVREAELAKVPYMIVVGEREAADRSVSVRRLRGEKSNAMPLAALVELLKKEPIPA